MKSLLCLLSCMTILFSEDVRSFAWRLPLSGDPEPNGYHILPVSRDMRARARQFPHDLRVVDAEGVDWPFSRLRPPADATVESLPFYAHNRLHIEGPEGYRQVDLHLAPERLTHSRIVIETDGNDFVRRVELYGSEDQETWGLMAMGYLIHTSRPRNVQENEIRYPVSNLPYLRVRVFPNTRDALETFRIRNLRVEKPLTRSGPPLSEHPVTIVSDTRDRGGIQRITVDLGLQNQPVHAIDLQAVGRDYLRRVNIYMRNSENGEWVRRGGGNLYRIGGRTQPRLPIRADGRFVRIDIHNYDDPPLEAPSIQVLYRPDHLLIQAPASPSAPFLYLGSDTARPPRYDLSNRWERLSPTPEPVPLQAGELERNPAYRTGLSANLMRILTIVVVGALSVLVVSVIIRMMKSLRLP